MGGDSIYRAAQFSTCGKWRYLLERRWQPRANRQGTVMFIGLNPSTADGEVDDPTIRRCMGFAQDWGFDRLYVANLFAWRTPKPQALFAAEDPVGTDNDAMLLMLAARSRLILACWGRHGQRFERDRQVQLLLRRRLYCLGMNQDSTPVHPLYQRRGLQPTLFRPPAIGLTKPN